MADKPTVLPKWAEEDATDPTSGQPNVSEPPEAKKDSGFGRYDVPPRQWINWLARLTYRWILWAKEEIERLVSSDFAGRGLSMEGSPASINTRRRLTELTGPDTLLTSNFDGVFWYSSAVESHVISIGAQSVDEGGTETVLICREDSDFTLEIEALGTTIVWSFDESISADGYDIKPGEIIRLVKVATNSYVAYAPNGISETVELGGDFGSSSAVFRRTKNNVEAHSVGVLTHDSLANPTAGNAVSSIFRPAVSGGNNVYDASNSTGEVGIRVMNVNSDGIVSTEYYEFDGTDAPRSNSAVATSVSYRVS